MLVGFAVLNAPGLLTFKGKPCPSINSGAMLCDVYKVMIPVPLAMFCYVEDHDDRPNGN